MSHQPSRADPAEGARDVVDRELQRQENKDASRKKSDGKERVQREKPQPRA